jgi:hypothetical protein
MIVYLLLEFNPSWSSTLTLHNAVHEEGSRVEMGVVSLVVIDRDWLASAFDVAKVSCEC